MSNFFVKFVRWNENTISSLINKTVKFSTVYEFNDFNELRYIGGFGSICSKTHDILEVEITNISFLNNLQTFLGEKCNKECKTKITNLIKEGKAKQLLDPKENCLSLLQENLAYSSVGIFCVANLDVFDHDSAQLMFAHYAENLKGIALIYEIKEINNTIHNIHYDNGPKISSGEATRHIKWYDGDYQDINDFIYKSKTWEYENEVRIFSQPGNTPATEHNISLKAILYTPRFSGEEKTLFNINNGLYAGKLIIEAIYPSHSKHYFMMEKDNSKTIDFLKNTILPLTFLKGQ